MRKILYSDFAKDISRFKYFSEKERDLSLKIHTINEYLLSLEDEKYLAIFLKRLKSIWIIKKSLDLKVWIYNDISKQKLEKWVLYFEEDCKDAIWFRFLFVESKNFEKLEKLLESYLKFIGKYKIELDSLLRKNKENFTKTLEECNF